MTIPGSSTCWAACPWPRAWGVGASVGFNLVIRDTQAVIGDLASDSTSGTRGSFTSGGNVHISAENSGVAANIVVSGGIATGKASTETGTDTGGSTKNPGTGGTQGSNGSKQSNQDLSDWQKNWGSVLNQAKDDGKFSVNSDIASLTDGVSDTTNQTSQNKSGVGVSASVAVNWADEDARAYVLNAGQLTLTGSTLTVEAVNSTGTISLAGGVGFAVSSGTGTGVGFGGAFGINVLYGTTDAFIEGVTGMSLGGLVLNADRTGWIVSLAAGFAGATGSKGYAVGGSVGVNVTAYTTEAALRDVTGVVDVNDDVILSADDTTVVVAVGGSGGFGGKAGFGVAIGVNVLANTIRSEIDGLTDFSHGGDLTVQAQSNLHRGFGHGFGRHRRGQGGRIRRGRAPPRSTWWPTPSRPLC